MINKMSRSDTAGAEITAYREALAVIPVNSALVHKKHHFASVDLYTDTRGSWGY